MLKFWKEKRRNERKRWLITAFLFLLLLKPLQVFAGQAEEAAAAGMKWNTIFTDAIVSPQGVVQSVCLTDHYIITIENTADDPNQPDTVSAYYRNNVDKNGNPVQQYSLAKRVSDTHWEHGNGMTYNPNTGYIYVAPYTSVIPENLGCVFIMDPESLAYVDKIKVTDSYNILAIDYIRETDQYLLQSNDAGQYRIVLTDASFTILDDFGPADPSPGTNFQDFCVTGRYVAGSPLTYGMGIGEYFFVYSLDQRGIVAMQKQDFQFPEAWTREPESFCQLSSDTWLCVETVVAGDGKRTCAFLTATIPEMFRPAATPAPAAEQAAADLQQQTAAVQQTLSGTENTSNTLNSQDEKAWYQKALTEQKTEKAKKGVPVILIVILLILAAGGAAVGLLYLRARKERERRKALYERRKQRREQDRQERLQKEQEREERTAAGESSEPYEMPEAPDELDLLLKDLEERILPNERKKKS